MSWSDPPAKRSQSVRDSQQINKWRLPNDYRTKQQNERICGHLWQVQQGVDCWRLATP